MQGHREKNTDILDFKGKRNLREQCCYMTWDKKRKIKTH